MSNNSHKDEFLKHVESAAIELLCNQSLALTPLCKKLAISRSHLHRKIKKLTGQSTSLYLRKIRIDRAKFLLETTTQKISHIAYDVGVTPQNLSKYFQLEYAITPSSYRNEYELIKGNPTTDRSTITQDATLVSPQINSIAILPFENFSNQLKDGHFSDGMTEEILYGLSQLDNLYVAGRSSSFYFKGTTNDIVEIGRQLAVAHILTGSVRIKDNKLRIIVRLSSTIDGFQVWTERYDRAMEDVFEIQEDIANKVMAKLKITLKPNRHPEQILRPKTQDIKAYELYLKGREQFELRNDLDLSLRYFKQATAVDERFVHAYFGIAYAMLYKCIFAGQRPIDAYPEILSAYEKAISIDPSGAEGHIINGWIKFYFKYDSQGAISSMDRAITANPHTMDAYRIKAYFFAFNGRFKQAIPLAEKAYQMDPLGYNAWFSVADIYRRAGKYDEAISLFSPLIPKFPDNILLNEILALSYYYKGDLIKADKTFANQQELPTRISIWSIGRYLYHYYHGDKSLLTSLLNHLEKLQTKKWIQPTIFSLVHFHLGHKDKAITYLYRAVEEQDFGLKHIISEPHWDPFRSHPVLIEILKNLL